MDTVKYYNDRAEIYDQTAGYLNQDSVELRKSLKALFDFYLNGKDILEIACGTGFWTSFLASIAKSVTAVDINPPMITIAKEKCRLNRNVEIIKDDCFKLEKVNQKFNGLFHHFWWSHIPINMTHKFISLTHSKLKKNSVVVMADNAIHSNHKYFFDDAGNRIEIRDLPNGKDYHVIKNLPTKDELINTFRDFSENIEYHLTQDGTFWILAYTIF